MTEQTLIERAIESAKCRIYRVRANVGNSMEHQVKADNQAEIQQFTIQALEEWQQYRTIGTVEELQTLKEKEEPKKPIYTFECIDGTKFYTCTVCETYVMHAGIQRQVNYCSHCGTKLDWE